jgi:hypothetical protein
MLALLATAAAIALAIAGFAIFLVAGAEARTYGVEDNLVFSLRGLDRLVPGHGYLAIGVVPLLLALVGTAGALIQREPWLRSYALMGLVAVALMYGPWSRWAPYGLLLDRWPFFDRLRTPLRFLPVAQLATAVIAAYAVAWIRRRASSPGGRALVAAGATGLLLLHFFPANPYYTRRPEGVGVWTREPPAITDTGLAPYRLREDGDPAQSP